MDWMEFAGWGGALLVLAVYCLAVVRKWEPESGRYMLISSCAAMLLVVHAARHAAYPFLITNAAILLVTMYTLWTKGKPRW